MMQEYVFNDEHSFVEKLRELADEGFTSKQIQTYSPIPVPHADEIIKTKPTFVRVYAIAGALTGTLTGLALTIYSVLRYPLITGGKPLVSILPFMIIAFELTILFGALATFAGFLLVARLPSVPNILEPRDYGNQFAIIVSDGA